MVGSMTRQSASGRAGCAGRDRQQTFPARERKRSECTESKNNRQNVNRQGDGYLQPGCKQIIVSLQTMKEKVYLFSLWVATLMVLSSTILTHHHHQKEVCFMVDDCVTDPPVTDPLSSQASSGDDSRDDHCFIEHFKLSLVAKANRLKAHHATALLQLPAQAAVVSDRRAEQPLPALDIHIQAATVIPIAAMISVGGFRAPPSA